MKQIIYNARTAEVTEIEVEDIEIPTEEIVQEPTEIELLKAQVKANAEVTDFHEELIVELAMMLYR